MAEAIVAHAQGEQLPDVVRRGLKKELENQAASPAPADRAEQPVPGPHPGTRPGGSPPRTRTWPVPVCRRPHTPVSEGHRPDRGAPFPDPRRRRVGIQDSEVRRPLGHRSEPEPSGRDTRHGIAAGRRDNEVLIQRAGAEPPAENRAVERPGRQPVQRPSGWPSRVRSAPARSAAHSTRTSVPPHPLDVRWPSIPAAGHGYAAIGGSGRSPTRTRPTGCRRPRMRNASTSQSGRRPSSADSSPRTTASSKR